MARQHGFFLLTRTVLLVGLGLLIAGTAVFSAVFFHDRTALTTMPARWAIIWTITAAGLAAWLWWDVRQTRQFHLDAIARRWLPLAIPTIIALLVYGSDTIYHWFITRNRARILCGALVLAALALIWLAQQAARHQAAQPATAWSAALAAARPVVLGASLFVMGLLQAASFVHLAVDDFGRYWTIADTLAAGGGYQVWTASAGTAQGGESGYWTDLPVLPLLMLVSFSLFGRTLTAAHVPLLLANIVLPFVLYALYLRLTGHRLWAFVGTALILFMPFFQIYTLGSSEPDPLLVVLVAALVWRVAVLAQSSPVAAPRDLRWNGLTLGILAAATALVRPEGIVYAALIPAGLLFHQRSRRAVWWALGPAGVLVGGFAVALWPAVQRPWPQAPRELDLANIPANLQLASKPLEHAATQLYVSEPALLAIVLLVLVLALLGAISLIRAWPALIGLPIALLAHGTLLLLLDPFSLRTADPPEFLRHISYAWPLLLGLILPLFPRLSRVPQALSVVGAVLLVSAFAYLTGTPEEIYAKPGRGSLLRSDIYLLWTDLLRVPYELPTQLDDTSFFAARDDLFDTYRPYDLHGIDYGFDYQLASWLAFIAALPFVAIPYPAHATHRRGTVAPLTSDMAAALRGN
ncbi:MAG: hypothetical protein CL878_07365 [Dehalococcoidia bacterium]|nr:hypothetical protein [Dehalococcoidia bacterium]